MPHVMKAVAINVAMIGPYDQMKERMWNIFGESTIGKPVAIIYASLFGTAFALPFDNIKTRMQNQFADKSLNRMNYNGFWDCCRTSFYTETATFSLVGFYTMYGKVLSYAFLTLYMTDAMFDVSRRNSGLAVDYL